MGAGEKTRQDPWCSERVQWYRQLSPTAGMWVTLGSDENSPSLQSQFPVNYRPETKGDIEQ